MLTTRMSHCHAMKARSSQVLLLSAVLGRHEACRAKRWSFLRRKARACPHAHKHYHCLSIYITVSSSGVPRGVWGVQTPPPEIPKALQNRAKLNPIVKTVKNC